MEQLTCYWKLTEKPSSDRSRDLAGLKSLLVVFVECSYPTPKLGYIGDALHLRVVLSVPHYIVVQSWIIISESAVGRGARESGVRVELAGEFESKPRGLKIVDGTVWAIVWRRLQVRGASPGSIASFI